MKKKTKKKGRLVGICAIPLDLHVFAKVPGCHDVIMRPRVSINCRVERGLERALARCSVRSVFGEMRDHGVGSGPGWG